MLGRTLGHYRIVEQIGAGGMGVAYKARDLHLDRFVALKILPPETVADPDRTRRFVQEPGRRQPSITRTSSPSTTSPGRARRTSSPWSTSMARRSSG